MIKIKTTAFTELSNSDFGTKTQVLINNTVAPVFPTPSPSLAVIQAALESYMSLVTAASGGERSLIQARNDQRVVLTALLIDLSAYVAYTVRNSPTAKQQAESTGFVVAKKGGHVGELEIPGDLESAVSKEPGAVSLKWKSVYGASSYVIEMVQGTATPTSVWEEVVTITKTKYKTTGLNPGQFYSFRVRAVGAAGYSEPSDVATSVVG